MIVKATTKCFERRFLDFCGLIDNIVPIAVEHEKATLAAGRKLLTKFHVLR